MLVDFAVEFPFRVVPVGVQYIEYMFEGNVMDRTGNSGVMLKNTDWLVETDAFLPKTKMRQKASGLSITESALPSCIYVVVSLCAYSEFSGSLECFVTVGGLEGGYFHAVM